MAGLAQIFAESEIRGCLRVLAGRQFELALHFIGFHHEAAVGAILRPVAERVQVARGVDTGDYAKVIECERDFIWAHDHS